MALQNKQLNASVQKSDIELFGDLREDLLILRDAISATLNGKPEQVKIVVTLLRTLICDKARGTSGGLLTHLVEKYNSQEPIVRDTGAISLENFRKEIVQRVSGSESYALTRCQIIQSTAQQEGIAHEALRRHRRQFLFHAVAEMAKTEKSDLMIYLFVNWGFQVLNLGERFLHLHGLSLER